MPADDVDWTIPPDLGLNLSALPTLDVGFDLFSPEKFPGRFVNAVDALLKSKERVYRTMTPWTAFGDDWIRKKLVGLSESCGGMPFEPPLFGRIYRALFRPSPSLLSAIDETYRTTGLKGGRYSAVHLRLRHPQGWDRPAPGRESGATADKSGLSFEDERTRREAVRLATHAIECSLRLHGCPAASPCPRTGRDPIYLFSDSNDTIALFVGPGGASQLRGRADAVPRIVSRDVSSEALHLAYADGRQHLPVEFFGMFVDLYVAIGARCVTFGIGGFGRLAAKISGTTCVARHRDAERYNFRSGKSISEVEVCHLTNVSLK